MHKLALMLATRAQAISRVSNPRTHRDLYLVIDRNKRAGRARAVKMSSMLLHATRPPAPPDTTLPHRISPTQQHRFSMKKVKPGRNPKDMTQFERNHYMLTLAAQVSV